MRGKYKGSYKETNSIVRMEINMFHPRFQTTKVVIDTAMVVSKVVQLLQNFISAILNVIELGHNSILVFIPMVPENIHINLYA